MPTLSEALGAYPKPLRESHIEFDSLQKVPDSHHWPRSNDYPISNDDSIPVIDLTHPDVVAQLGRACETWGVFQLVNHGVAKSVLERLEEESRRLFALPVEQKLKGIRGADQTGYGIPPVSSFFNKYMWAEGFTIVQSPEESVRRIWPEGYKDFCDVVEEYRKAMRQLAIKLLWLMLAHLGIAKEDTNFGGPTGDIEGATIALQMNWYPLCPDPDRCMGLVEHSDSPFVTILFQTASIRGLEVLREHDAASTGPRWVTIDPIDGALTINVGDLLQVFTNGRFKSVLHRVLVNRDRSRFSIAHFLGPPTGVPIFPCPKLVDPDHPRLYGQVSWDEYIAVKAKHHNGAISSLRLHG